MVPATEPPVNQSARAEEVLQDVLRRQRGNGEVKALQPRRRHDRTPCPPTNVVIGTGQRNREARPGCGKRLDSHAEAKAPKPKKAAVPDGDLPGETHQDVQPQRRDAQVCRSGSGLVEPEAGLMHHRLRKVSMQQDADEWRRCGW